MWAFVNYASCFAIRTIIRGACINHVLSVFFGCIDSKVFLHDFFLSIFFNSIKSQDKRKITTNTTLFLSPDIKITTFKA